MQAYVQNGSEAVSFWETNPENGAPVPVALTSGANAAATIGNMPPSVANAVAFCAAQSVAIAPATAVFNGPAPYVTTYPAPPVNGGLPAAQPDVPRNVVAAWTGAAICTVKGVDSAGQAMSEVSASGTTFVGNKAFAFVTSISFSAAVTAMTAGFGAKLGLPFRVSSGDIFGVTFNDAADAGTLVLADLTNPATSSTGDPKGTYTPAGTLNGAKYLAATLKVTDTTTQVGAWGIPQA